MRLTRAASLLGAVLASAGLFAQNPPCFDLNLGTDLRLGDDATAQGLALGFSFTFAGVTYTDVCVCSNGYIWLGPTSVSGGDFTPTEAELLSGAPRICPLWTDFNPGATGSGHVYFNAVPASGANPAYALITWSNVYEFGTTSPKSVQVRMDANNNITVTYDSNCANISGGTLNSNAIVGASPGGGAASNLVSFATRPFASGGDTFCEVIAVPGFAYGNTSMLWIATAPSQPGYQIVDRTCTPNNLPGPAEWAKVGIGCPTPTSVYELFSNATTPIDLSNLSFLFVPNGQGGYVVLQPGGNWFGGFANNLGAGDDTVHTLNVPFAWPHDGGTLSTMVASSNGFVWLDGVGSGSACCAGSAPAFLSGLPRVAGMWTDLNASPTSSSGAGAVYADLDTATGHYVVTWAGIGEFGQPGASNTFQIAFHPNGPFEIRYQSVAMLSPTRVALAGYSAGNPARDNPVDLSMANGLNLGPSGRPLDLNAATGSLPRLNSTFTMDLSGIRATSLIAVLVLGFEASPPIDLGTLGATGCSGYVNVFGAPSTNLVAVTGGAALASFSLVIPNNVSLAGVTLMAQGAAPAAVNPLGYMFSNGGRMVVGL